MQARTFFLLAALLVSVSGCPSATTPGPVDAASGDSGAVDAAETPDAGAIDAAAEEDAATSDAAAADAGSGDASTSDTATPSFSLAIVDPYAYGNCFGGPPDPLLAGWTAHVTGPAGDVITLTQATLHVAVPSESYSEDQLITVTVPSFPIPASGLIDQEQRKATGTPSVPICTFCDATVEALLTVTYTSTGGGSVTLSQPIEGVGCVF